MSLIVRRLFVICLMIAGCPVDSTGAQIEGQGLGPAESGTGWPIPFDQDAKCVYHEDYESGKCDRIRPNSSVAVVSREDGATVHAGKYCLRGNFDPKTTDPITRKQAATKSAGLADIEVSQAGVKDGMYISYWWRLDPTNKFAAEPPGNFGGQKHAYITASAEPWIKKVNCVVGQAWGPDHWFDPLRRRVQDNGGRVYRNGPPFTLMIDVKTDAGRTYAVLAEVLSGYAELLSSVRNGVVEERAVTVIISGNRAEQAVADAPLRYVAIDGRLVDLDTQRPSHLVPLISDNWCSHFRWRGQGPMPEHERQKLRGIVEKAHAKGRRVRFWAAPDDPAVWRELVDAGVDLLNADDLAGLERFLRSQNPEER